MNKIKHIKLPLLLALSSSLIIPLMAFSTTAINFNTTSYQSNDVPTLYKTSHRVESKSNLLFPHFIMNQDINQTLPSDVHSYDYTDYFSLNDPTVIESISNLNPNDAKGTLQINAEYYTTSQHTQGSPTDNREYNFGGFASSVEPTINVNKDAIAKITENDFEKIINNNGIAKIMGDLDSYVIMNGITPEDVVSIEYNNGLLTIVYYSTSWNGSPTYVIKQKISGFMAPSNNDAAIIASVVTVLVLILLGLAGWYYHVKVRGRNSRQRGDGPIDHNETSQQFSGKPPTGQPPSNNQHQRNFGPNFNRNSPYYAPERKIESYSPAYSNQHPPRARGQRPMQQHPMQVRQQHPMQPGRQYPMQPGQQYPMQASKNKYDQNKRNNSRKGNTITSSIANKFGSVVNDISDKTRKPGGSNGRRR